MSARLLRLCLARAARSLVAALLGLAAAGALALEINTASEADLDAIDGCGPATTARILAARRQGAFADWADLMRRVKGIRAATAARWAAQGVTVAGQSWPPPPASPAEPPASARDAARR